MIIYEEILKEFYKKKVKYVLVGGLAVNFLGGSRNTSDLDVLVEMSDVNLRKLVGILKKRGYSVRQPVDPMRIADRKTREDWIHNKHMKAFNFYKDSTQEEVDIIIESPVSFEDAKKDAIIYTVNHIRIPVISIDKLIKMKRKAARLVDEGDIQDLIKIKKARNKYDL